MSCRSCEIPRPESMLRSHFFGGTKMFGSNYVTTLWKGLGGCSYCMKQSFSVAILSWFCLGISVLCLESKFVFVCATLSTITTLLWVLHVAFYTKRVVSSNAPNLARRQTFGIIAKSAAAAITISLVPTFASATVNCGAGQSCPDGNICCRTMSQFSCCNAATEKCNDYGGCDNK